MKLLNGFRKKYFTLSSILVYSVSTKLHSTSTVYKNHLNNKLQISSDNKSEEEESPPNLQETILCFFKKQKTPCHCDCIFKNKTKLAICLFNFIPRCPYYDTFFAFRRTGTHPPIFIFY